MASDDENESTCNITEQLAEKIGNLEKMEVLEDLEDPKDPGKVAKKSQTSKDKAAIREKYLQLLASSEEEESKEIEDNDFGGIEIKFTPGLKDFGEKLVQSHKEKKEKQRETLWEAKMREKREKKREARKMKKSEAEIKEDVSEDPFNDPFFQQVEDIEFPEDIDMEYSTEKNTKKQNKSKQQENKEINEAQDPKKQAELELLMLEENVRFFFFSFSFV